MSEKKSVEEFKNEIDTAPWALLEDHYKRGALFIIDKKLKLEEVANAFSRDYSDIVKIWLDNKEIQIVDEDLSKKLAQNPHDKVASFVIVQPYVLIQLLD